MDLKQIRVCSYYLVFMGSCGRIRLTWKLNQIGLYERNSFPDGGTNFPNISLLGRLSYDLFRIYF